ncbi:hypothetical protein QJQ45_011174 [Haematococcus lacustris]|nr:hypothetical protein QJQ45_011174 [Haematococcus lacustris]
MPPVKKVTRISRANGAKAKARHEAAKSMEQLTATHATLTAAHAALNADLLSSREQYSQLREWHRSLLVSAGQREQQWELDLLGWVQQLEQLEEAFLQQLQGTQAQLTDTAAALEAAQKDLAAARTELAHTKQQLTTTNIKLEQLRAQLDGCTIPAHGKVVLFRVTAAVRCFGPSPAAAAGSPSPAPAAAADSPNPAPAAAAGSPSPAPALPTPPAPMPTARTPEVQEMPSLTPQLEVKARVVAVRKCPDSSSHPAVQQFVDVCRKQGVWGSLASITVDSAAGNIGRISGLAVSINALRRQHGLALIIFWPCVSHQIHNALHKAMTTWGKAEGWGRQGLQAQLALSIEQLCSLTKKHWDLLGLSQKRDKETTSANDNREAKAARKTEESACMVDGNAKMVLNVPTQAPLQQLQQAFQQHARGADYSNTSAKEATRFTREQLRAYLLYHKVPPRDQPVGRTLVAGWQKAVQKHIAERGSPTGHGVLP